jgi:hypothetical protein
VGRPRRRRERGIRAEEKKKGPKYPFCLYFFYAVRFFRFSVFQTLNKTRILNRLASEIIWLVKRGFELLRDPANFKP